MQQDKIGVVRIREGRTKSIINRHPWVFSGAIYHAEDAAPGSIVTVEDHEGRFLGRGYWNARSQIQVRILTWDDEPIDAAWWRRMLKRAISARQSGAMGVAADACRLINAENDFLPGLVVDRYGEWLVLQALTLGIDVRKQEIAALLADLLPVRGVYERSDVDVRGKEELRPARGVLWGEEPPRRIRIHELADFDVDIQGGQKTGFYLDQRENRRLTYDLIKATDQPTRILNLFSYTGGFGISAQAAGAAHIVHVDSSQDSLDLTAHNIALNGFDSSHAEMVNADAFAYLRTALKSGDSFDLIVCDPPKFAQSKAQVDRAARGYKDLNLQAFKLIRPGGYLLTFSCSGAVDADLFQKIIFGALADSGRAAQIIRHLGPAPDHPVALTFPEGAYLKGLLLKVY